MAMTFIAALEEQLSFTGAPRSERTSARFIASVRAR